MNVAPTHENSKYSPLSLSKKDIQQKVVPQSQSSFDFQIDFGTSLDKSLGNELFKAITLRTESAISAELTSYFFQSNNLLIRFRKNDFIFPFHYFW